MLSSFAQSSEKEDTMDDSNYYSPCALCVLIGMNKLWLCSASSVSVISQLFSTNLKRYDREIEKRGENICGHQVAREEDQSITMTTRDGSQTRVGQ